MKKIKHSAFSLVELTISMLVIAVIIAALTPIISKRLSASSSIKNRISTDCDSYYPDGFCAMCYITPKSCISCTRSCASDEYKNVSSCVCEKCSIRYNDLNCVGCNSKKCTQCSDGYYLNSVGKCVICPLGHYCYRSGETSVKSPCSRGTAAPREGMSVCDRCLKSDEGTTGSVATAVGSVSCVDCGAGYYAKDEAQGVACEVCPVGYYCPQGKIIPCPLGYANNLTGQKQCFPCVRSTESVGGSVAASRTMVNCSLCGDGNYAGVSAQGEVCTVCPRGYYCPQGRIIPCPKGTANNSLGQSVCVGCNRSSAVAQGNYASSVGMTSCVSCSAGYYAKQDRQSVVCSKCVAGYACPSGKFVQCGVGTYSAAGAVSCVSCPSGSTSAVGATSCQSCAVGCSVCSGVSTNCTLCKAGYYKSGASCVQCQAGYYCAGGTSDRVKCPSGSASTVGAVSCKKCSDFSLQCVACSVSGCMKCVEGYEVDGVGCKVSFDCEAEGGIVCGNFCIKKVSYRFYTPDRTLAPINISEICGSTWREPSDMELCMAQLQCKTRLYRTHQPSHYYVGGTYADTMCESYNAAAHTCYTSTRSSGEIYYTLRYSPTSGCGITGYGSSNGRTYYTGTVYCTHDIK